MKIVILEQAKEDLIAGYVFYENQDPGIGDYFFDSVNSDIESLLIHHGSHRIVFGFHRFLAKTFPFSIYYRVVDDLIFIDAILDQRSNPVSVRDALRRRNPPH